MRFTLVFLGCLVAFNVNAVEDICAGKGSKADCAYKCTEENGKVYYRASDDCPGGHSAVIINLKTGVETNLDELRKKQALAEQEHLGNEENEEMTKKQLAELQERIKNDAIKESKKNQLHIKNNPTTYSAYAIPPYEPDHLPDLAKNFQARLPDIERMRREASEKALATNTCERVESAELDNKTTKNNLMFAIICSSGKTLTYSETDLKK